MEEPWGKKEKLLHEIAEGDEDQKVRDKSYFHYTSLEVLFNILDHDEFWISNARFSNDLSEEFLLKSDERRHDDYIICFCEKDDQLSQWRGYCYKGGATIQIEAGGPHEFSILHGDYDSSHKYVLYSNIPLPVLYVDVDDRAELIRRINFSLKNYKDFSLQDIVPYIKNKRFIEEKECRMVFTNDSKGSLSQCIRFRKLDNGVKVPYMVVKHGDIGKMKGYCDTDPKECASEDKLKDLSNQHQVIRIEEGSDQENIYYDIKERIQRFLDKNPLLGDIPVFCKGHLPISHITVAPTYDRKRIEEEIRVFCKSKYWLRDVIVTSSDIPYIPPIL